MADDGAVAGRYAYIVACNSKYLPGLNAIVNSLDMVGNRHDLIVLSWKLPGSYLKALNAVQLSYTVIFHELTQHEVDWLGEAEALLRKRFALASELDYDAYCLLDADMFFCIDVERYFTIAHKTGFVLGCTLEQKRNYGDADHQYPADSGKYLIDPTLVNLRDLASAPLFFGSRWAPALKRSFDIYADHSPGGGRFLASDMDAFNICLLEAGSFDYTVPLSQHTWTGLHECMMKAHTRAVIRHDRLFTEDGEEINIVHGRFWSRAWRESEMANQFRMIDREFSGLAAYRRLSIESFQLLSEWFRNAASRHKIAINQFLKHLPCSDGTIDAMDLP